MPRSGASRLLPADLDAAVVGLGEARLKLTNLRKPFFPHAGLTKGDLLQYYAEISPVLLPHLRDRPMVMKRYPHGAGGDFFFMKRAPAARPPWVSTVDVAHSSGSKIEFVLVQDLASLLWVINLGCIDLNPWYSRRDDLDRPDYLHFDLDPVKGPGEPPWPRVVEAALEVRRGLEGLGMTCVPKTTGSRGIHLYVPIRRGPTQKEVWTVAKAVAVALAAARPKLLTAEYRIARRPAQTVLVDYNQNAWGQTLASVYSVRPTPTATVSTPLAWTELERGVDRADFHLRNMAARVRAVGDLWAPLAPGARRRFDLASLLATVRSGG